MKKVSARGRRPGRPDTKDLILEAARRRFLADGYQMTTMRSIATEAGVDVALVSYYFGSKQGVFAAAMALQANPAEVLEAALQGDPVTLAADLLRNVLAIWDDEEIGLSLRTVAAVAVGDPKLNRAVSEAISREVVGRLAEHLAGPESAERAAAFCVQMAGIIFSRYLLHLEPITSMTTEEIVRHLAPSLQLVLQDKPHPVKKPGG